MSIQNNLQLVTDNNDINRAFRFAMSDIWSNIRPYSGGLSSEDEALCAGFDYLEPWTRDTAINIMNGGGFLYPEVLKNNLYAVLLKDDDGYFLCDSVEVIESSGNYWDSIIWVIGAWHYYVYTGNIDILPMVYQVAKRTLSTYEAEEYDKTLELFRGCGVYADGISAYPDHYLEENPIYADIAHWPNRNPQRASKVNKSGQIMCTLSNNCVFYEAYMKTAKIADKLGYNAEAKMFEEKAQDLKKSINKNFWRDDLGTYIYLIDEIASCQYQEGLGLAFAILFGVSNAGQNKQILDNLKSTPHGIACVEPTFDRYKLDADSFGRHSGTVWPFIQMFIAEASVKANNIKVYEYELEKLTESALKYDGFYEIYHPITGRPYGGVQEAGDWRAWESVPRQTWSATGYFKAICSGIFGMSFLEDKILFAPNSDITLVDNAKFSDFKYRDMVLNIRLSRTGSASVIINGDNMDSISGDFIGIADVVITI